MTEQRSDADRAKVRHQLAVKLCGPCENGLHDTNHDSIGDCLALLGPEENHEDFVCQCRRGAKRDGRGLTVQEPARTSVWGKRRKTS
jgi:hypothetical protein